MTYPVSTMKTNNIENKTKIVGSDEERIMNLIRDLVQILKSDV